MMVVSGIFLTFGILLSIHLMYQLRTNIADRNKEYALVKADIKGVETWVERSSQLDSSIKWYCADLEYSHNGIRHTGKMNCRWESECSGDYMELYISCENPQEIITIENYKALKGYGNMIAIIIFHLMFIITSFTFAYHL